MNDNIVEPNETFSVLLNTSSLFVDITQDSATITIVDNDTVTIGWSSVLYTIREDDTDLTVCVMILDGEIARPVVVFYSTVDDTAKGTSMCVSHC